MMQQPFLLKGVGLAFLVGGGFAAPAIAAPDISPPRLPRSIVQDLTRIDSQDFFRQGRLQFEQQIHQHQQRRRTPTPDLLKIGPGVGRSVETSPLERLSSPSKE